MRVLFAVVCMLAIATAADGATLVAWGEHTPSRSVSCLDDQQRAAIQARIAENVTQLRKQGRLTVMSPTAVSLAWPVDRGVGLSDYGVHGVSNFVDHNPAYPGSLQDYNCGARTYDAASGYNHSGIDIFSWPFGWFKMDHDQARVVAAAGGEIVGKDDGYYDRSCTLNGNPWNAVYVRHADGSIAWYGHLKNGSLTPKPIGASVVAGEFLGIVGSSGNSTGPHLHFELHDAFNTLVDPYGGPCNTWNASWWAVQRPYYDSAINALRTHSAPPVHPPCPQTEVPNEQDVFAPGSRVYLAAYFRDLLLGQLSQYAIYDAAGAVFDSWSASGPAPHYAAAYALWYVDLPASGLSTGEWRFESVYEGKTYEHRFWVGDPLAASERPGGRLTLTRVGANPATGAIEMEYRLPRDGVAELAIYDVRGRRLATLANGWRPAGPHRVRWDASRGVRAPLLGLARLRFAGESVTEKIVLAP